MSDLHRSAISARLAKLPLSLPTAQEEDEEDEDDEMINTIGDLPGSGMGPPAMQVIIFIGVVPMFKQKLKGPVLTCVQNPNESPT